MILVGIDVAKDKHDCFICNSEGEVLCKTFTFHNSMEGFNILFEKIKSVSDDLSKLKVGLEATGHYSYNLLGFLLDKGFPTFVINPLHTNLYRKSLSLRKTKTDKVDAHTIAMMLMSDVDLKPYSNTLYHNEELKSLTRYRFDKVRERAKLKSSVSRLVNILFPELESLVPTLHMKSIYALLSEFPSAHHIADAHLTRLKQSALGKYNRDTAVRFRNAARNSIGSVMPAKSLELKHTIKLIGELTSEIDEIEGEIKRIVDNLGSPIFSIPGIGYAVGAMILAEIGDFNNFSSPDKILAYSGMSPSTYQSGQLKNCYSHMEKRGSRYLRFALYNAARDSSKKIRAVFKAKGESGKPLTATPPYGYLKAPDNPNQWVIDEEAAEVVKRIYSLCMAGYGTSQICKLLEKEQVLCPRADWVKNEFYNYDMPEKPYKWRPNTISRILSKKEYLGHTVNFKTYKKSYKSKKKLDNPEENQMIFENTHEPIIDIDTWEKVQDLRKNKRRPTRTGKTNMFSGVVYCADCGQKLYYCTSKYFESRQDHFVCSTSRKQGTDVCDTHFIRAVVLEQGVLQHLRYVINFVASFEDRFREIMGAKHKAEVKRDIAAKRRAMAKAEKRIAELDRLFKSIYEDKANGMLNESRFKMLADDYEREQQELSERITVLSAEVEQQEEQSDNIERFIGKVHKYFDLQELTPTILNDMVQRVYVHAPEKINGKRTQQIDIYYDLVGFLPMSLFQAKARNDAA